MIKNFKLMHLRRLFVFFVALCIAIPQITLIADAQSEKPQNPQLTYSDDFSDGVIAPNVGTSRFYPGDEDGSNADTLTESGGKLTFERQKFIWSDNKSYGEPAVELYATEDHLPIAGDVFAEFTLTKTREVVRIRLCDSVGNYLTQLSWEGNTLSMLWRESDLSSQRKSITAYSFSSVKVTLRADMTSSRPVFSLWINDKLQIDSKISAIDMTEGNFLCARIYTLLYSEYSKSGNFTIDNVRMGYSEFSNLPSVESMIMETEFDGESAPCLIEKELAGGGTVETVNGALSIIKTGSGLSAVGASVYNSNDASHCVEGVIGLEFDLSRKNANTVQVRSMDGNGELYYSFSWGAKSLSSSYSDNPLSSGTTHGVWQGDTNSIHVNMMFDTLNSKYWLWINGSEAVSGKYSRSVGVSSLCYTMIYIEQENEVYVDNYRIYNAVPPANLRLDFDMSALDYEDILKDNPADSYAISSDLSLPTALHYGTTVVWQSSHPEIINPSTGVLTRPSETSENLEVTLTAVFSNNGESKQKEYKFNVLRITSDNQDIAEAELDGLDISYLTDELPSQIRKSLRLCDKGAYGSDIIWTSSDPSHITTSGRVIRPRFDEEDSRITLTASIGEYSKNFDFVVKADDKPADPMHTSDEEFFGVWNGNSFTTQPQLDYSLSGLSGVLACVKSGDYTGAKEALLQYFKTRNVPSPIGMGTRHPGWVDARSDGLYELGEEAAYWKGLMTVKSDNFSPVTISLYKPSSISKSDCKTFEIIARYNENTSAYILGTDSDDSSKVPQLTLTIGGKQRVFKAKGSATIRAGKYMSTHISDNQTLEAKMFGEFLGDETKRVILSFDLSGVGSNETISKAELTVYAKKSSPSAEDKQLWIIDNKGSAWNEDTVKWSSLNFAVHNYNGLVGGVEWKGAPASDVEYAYQAPRFTHARSAMNEYRSTGDEKYAYSLLTQIMDIITDTGNTTPYPRSLDAALRMHQLVPLMNTLKNSPYLTADFCTAFMKNMYDQFEYFPSRADAEGNWREYEQLAVLYATVAYPELSNSKSTNDACIQSWIDALEKSFMPDGSYIEDTGGYHRTSFNMYRDFKKSCDNSGIELPEKFDTMLHKAAYYMALTGGPDGLMLQYGDEGGGKSSPNRYTDICDWYEDEELRFIDSFGESGTEPTFTSYQFPDGRYTTMRSDWSKNALYLHTNVRGGGGHGHADDNSIILMSGSRRLLVDSGKFTYNSYDPARMYGLSTRGHNTLVINDASQRMGWTGDDYTVRGNINSWHTNKRFDFLSQSTISYPDHDHTRNIFFDKTGLFVVTDIVNPHSLQSVNNYKQYWHMLPEANISADTSAKTLSSNFADGRNLILASADNAVVKLEDGYYDISDATVVSNKAGIFEITSSGLTSMDTAMYVSSAPGATVKAERINADSSNPEITALKISVSDAGINKTYYYMNNRTTSASSVNFGTYTSDAKTALVCEDSRGNILSVMLADGSYISSSSSDIVRLTKKATDFAAIYESEKLCLTSADSTLDPKGTTAINNESVTRVLYNDIAMSHSVSNGMICVGEDELKEVNSDLEAVISDFMVANTTIGSDGKTYLTGNLDLSVKKGENGSDITYNISDSALISSYGTIKRQLVDKDVTVTVTASNRNSSVKKVYELIVPGKYNKIGKEELPFIGDKHPASRTITDSNTSGKTNSNELTAFSNTGEKIKISSAYAPGKEPGFTCSFNTALSGEFIQEFIFRSDSAAMRTRFSDSAWNRKFDIYYLDNGTLTLSGASNATYPESFRDKTAELRLHFNMTKGTVDAYIGGKLWLDDFALVSGGYRNIQHVLTTHHCTTILGVWRNGEGTTTIYSSNVYTLAEKSSIASVMTDNATYLNGGVLTQGINKATVPVVATDVEGEEKGAMIVYAVYSGNGFKKLENISFKTIDLDRYSHKEYPIEINLDQIPANATQKVFVIDGFGTVTPASKVK